MLVCCRSAEVQQCSVNGDQSSSKALIMEPKVQSPAENGQRWAVSPALSANLSLTLRSPPDAPQLVDVKVELRSLW